METLIRFIILLVILIPFNNSLAEPVNGKLVVLQILDKITARISTIEILVGEKEKYDSIEIEFVIAK